MPSSNVDRVLDSLFDCQEEPEPEPEVSGDKVKQETEPEPEVTWEDVEDEWFEHGTDFLIF